ncbi:hypothetical protein CCR87_11260, partial [Rhodobaculum claviforme]|nr:hypothetical protein [Rhodobaculum claviforme]
MPSDMGGAAAILLASVGGNLLSLALPLAILQLYDRIIPAAALETLVVLLAGVTVALILEALLTFVRATLIAWAGARHEHAVGQRMFARLMAADPIALRVHGGGVHAERFAAISRIREFRAGQGLAVLADLPFALLFLALILVIGGWVAVIPVAVMAVFAAVLLLHDGAQGRAQRAAEDVRVRQLSFVLETLGRIGAVKAAGLEAPMLRRFERLLRGAARADHDVARGAVTGQVLQASLGGTSMVAVAAGGSLGVMAGEITLGELAACTLLANRALQPLQRVLGLWTGFRQQAQQRAHVAAGLGLPGTRPPGAPALPRLRGAIALDDVTVAGERDGPVILDRVSLSVEAGEILGITGAAGSGKSTLLMVMAGLRCPDLGRVRLDGRHDPWRHAEDSLLGQIVHVSARAPVFAGTLMENMTAFAPDPGARGVAGPRLDRARALDLAERVGLTGLAGRLPNGFNTEVGPGSVHALPHGVAQRIALVRALYGAPRIVLFDAANAALDSGADAMVRALLRDQGGHRTVVIVSQRPSLLAIAGRVLTVSAGRLHATDMSRAGGVAG